jgi:hypothetical protein
MSASHAAAAARFVTSFSTFTGGAGFLSCA